MKTNDDYSCTHGYISNIDTRFANRTRTAAAAADSEPCTPYIPSDAPCEPRASTKGYTQASRHTAPAPRQHPGPSSSSLEASLHAQASNARARQAPDRPGEESEAPKRDP
ncbi:hypothetical protein EVG20_g8564 [Dentipellis fragilis]|uniref:Uncharacterized protein n=1 Tax=Dentipellis fragilis TaxID=205917 RepID=A0A4Y9Y4L8_9AGAM|nr:hypothetical protein EVG20_g8564 [Dentipellis fragilis]